MMTSHWQNMMSAPKDDTVVQLLIKKTDLPDCIDGEEAGELTRSIGHNGFDHGREDEWQVVGWNWQQDCFTDVEAGRVKPVAWCPLASLQF